MKTDSQIQKDVMDEIKSDPHLNVSEIGVSVKNGIVTLSGRTDAFYKKYSAESAAKRVAGVKAVVEELEVGLAPSWHRTDGDIAEAILNALKWSTAVQEERIKIKVEKGNVKLEGEVEWDVQRRNAENTIKNLAGIQSITNLIRVVPKVSPAAIEQKIQDAFKRSATIDGTKITVDVLGGRVTLKGKVRSFAEKRDAEMAAWAAPGVSLVDSKLEVEIPEYAFED